MILVNGLDPLGLFFSIQSFGPVQAGLVIGAIGGFVTLLLLDNKKYPAGLVVVLAGL